MHFGIWPFPCFSLLNLGLPCFPSRPCKAVAFRCRLAGLQLACICSLAHSSLGRYCEACYLFVNSCWDPSPAVKGIGVLSRGRLVPLFKTSSNVSNCPAPFPLFQIPQDELLRRLKLLLKLSISLVTGVAGKLWLAKYGERYRIAWLGGRHAPSLKHQCA